MPTVFDNLVGSGGNELLERFKDWLADSPFELGTPNTFVSDDDTLVESSSTATFSNSNDTFDFSAGAEFVLSLQHLDTTEFLSVDKDVVQLELQAWWELGLVDPAAVYEVSRNGGLEFQTVTMTQVGSGDTFRGTHTFTEEAADQIISEYADTNDDSDLVFNDTTTQQRAQTFTTTSAQVFRKATLFLNQLPASSITGRVRAKLVRDDTGLPSTTPGDEVAISEQVSISTLSDGDNTVVVDFPNTALAAGTYWVVLEPDSDYRATFGSGTDELRVRGDSSAPAISDSAVFNGTTWSAAAGVALIFKLEGRELDLRVKITSSTGPVKLRGYGVLYDLSSVTPGLEVPSQLEIKQFSGDANTDTFTISKYLPNPELLRVFEAETGQVYVFPSFTVVGQDIVFPVDTFDKPGETITLIFDQNNGGAFDNSDENLLRDVENHLGSNDPTLDKSIAGRGLLIRNSSGILREVILNSDDEWEVITT